MNRPIPKEYKVKSLNYCRKTKQNDNNNIYFDSMSNLYELNDTALFYTNAYENIFGKKRSQETQCHKRLAIVRIKAGKRAIYRKYQYAPDISGIGENEIGLTNESIRLLAEISNTQIVGEKVKVSPANLLGVFPYYWNHPFHATRISYKLGLISLGIGIISLIIGCISLCISL